MFIQTVRFDGPDQNLVPSDMNMNTNWLMIKLHSKCFMTSSVRMILRTGELTGGAGEASLSPRE